MYTSNAFSDNMRDEDRADTDLLMTPSQASEIIRNLKAECKLMRQALRLIQEITLANIPPSERLSSAWDTAQRALKGHAVIQIITEEGN